MYATTFISKISPYFFVLCTGIFTDIHGACEGGLLGYVPIISNYILSHCYELGPCDHVTTFHFSYMYSMCVSRSIPVSASVCSSMSVQDKQHSRSSSVPMLQVGNGGHTDCEKEI